MSYFQEIGPLEFDRRGLGPRIDADWSVHPHGVNDEGKPWSHIVVWGHGAHQYAELLRHEFANRDGPVPQLMGGFDPASGATSQNAVQALWKGAAAPLCNALYIVLPGEYTDRPPIFQNQRNEGQLTIGGLAGPRPVWRWRGVIRFAYLQHVATRHMILEGCGLVHNADCGSTFTGGVVIDGHAQDGIMWGHQDSRQIWSNGVAGVRRDDNIPTAVVRDCVIRFCGQGNAYHGAYVSDRERSVSVYDSVFYGMKGSHCLKVTARRLVAIGNVFALAANDHEALETDYVGTTLLDRTAAGTSLIVDNLFYCAAGLFYPTDGPGTVKINANPFSGRARRSKEIQANGDPLPGTCAYNDPKTWHSWADWSGLNEPQHGLFTSPGGPRYWHFLVDNVFVRTDLEEGRNGVNWKLARLYNDGTAPRLADYKFSPTSTFLARPDGWFDRSIIAENDAISEGAMFHVEHDGTRVEDQIIDGERRAGPALPEREYVALDIEQLPSPYRQLVAERQVVKFDKQKELHQLIKDLNTAASLIEMIAARAADMSEIVGATALSAIQTGQEKLDLARGFAMAALDRVELEVEEGFDVADAVLDGIEARVSAWNADPALNPVTEEIQDPPPEPQPNQQPESSQ